MDDEKGLPKTSISSLIKEKLGKRVKYSNSFIEHVNEIANEFVMKVADEANKKCISKGKMKISNDDVFLSLEELGMKNYIEELKKLNDDFQKETNTEKNKFKHKIKNQAELERLKEQQNKELGVLALNYQSSQEFQNMKKFQPMEVYEIEDNDEEEDYENFE